MFVNGVYRANFPVDLHSHSTRSDGSDTPQELISTAADAGLRILAITDHDIRPPKEIEVDGTHVDAVEYAAGRGVILIRGIEVSCETTAEDCHIVCLGCNWTDPFFDKLEADVIQSKIDGYRETVGRLHAAGYSITWDEVLENGGNPVTEDRVQKKMIFELLARRGFFTDWSEAKLMVKNTPEFQVARIKPDPVSVIQSAHACGGIAIMAHPYLVNEPVHLPGESMSRDTYIRRLIDAGLDGIEARYTYEKTSYGGRLTGEQIAEEVQKKYSSLVHVISGGSDYHADMKKGVKNPRYVGECGLTLKEFQESPVLMNLLPPGAVL